MNAERFALVCALLAVVLLAARLRACAILVALCGLAGLVLRPSPPAPPPHAALPPVVVAPGPTVEGFSPVWTEEKKTTAIDGAETTPTMRRSYPPPIAVPAAACAAAAEPPPPHHPEPPTTVAHADGWVVDHYTGGCGRRPRPPAPPCPSRDNNSDYDDAPPHTDAHGHYVGDHAGHPTRGGRSAPNPLASASQCRDRLTRIVPVAGRCGYRDTTGQMSRFAHLR